MAVDYISLRENRMEFGPLHVEDADRDVLRKLAAKVAELAARPVEAQKRGLWYRHNALEPTRPLIFCDPENGWNEIFPPESLACRGSLTRTWEMVLRKELFWGERMGDDRVVGDEFPLPYVYRETDWGLHEELVRHGDGGSYVWEAPLKDYADMARLRAPRIDVDRDATDVLRALAEEVFDGLLRVRVKGFWYWSLGLSWNLAKMRGLETMMCDFFERPDDLHRLMAFFRDATLDRLDFLESQGLLSLNNDGAYVGSGGFGWTRELPREPLDGRPPATRDLWGFCESQETVGWSPDQFEEFVFAYQLPILERFGLNCYGCCEPLHTRWHVIRRAPRLRRVSVSPWANLDLMAEYLGRDYIFSWKPQPADLAMPVLDADRVRARIREGLRAARGCCVEIILKDTHTIGGNPENVVEWCRIAREEAESV